MKFCPILKAGTMIKNYEKTFTVGSGMGESRHNDISSDSPECKKGDCEWYLHGCPAYPKEEV